jgi:pantothenate kinase
MYSLLFALQHTVLPVFMQHEGYMGAIGVLASQIDPPTNGSLLHTPDSTTCS